MAVTDVIHDEGGAVFNVKAYGAVGDGSTNDTAAFQAAITAASLVPPPPPIDSVGSDYGSVVYVPHGIYLINSTLTLPNGVGIKGAGMRTAQLRFNVGASADGLVWSGSSSRGFGGLLEDVDIIAAGTLARNLVVVDNWTSFAINRVRIRGAELYNLYLHDCLNLTATHLESFRPKVSALYIDSTSDVSTTCRFTGCYFQESQNGPCVDVEGLGLHFDSCVFESSATATTQLGIGAQVRWGTATFVAPYFENNSLWDLISGTEDRPVGYNRDTSVTVINPIIRTGGEGRNPLGGCLKFERGSATVLGGDFGGMARPIVLTPTTGHVFLNANTRPYSPVMEGDLGTARGAVFYTDWATGQNIQTGLPGHAIGGGTLIKKHLSFTPDDWVPGSVANGAVASTTFTGLVGVELGDTVVVGGRTANGIFPTGVFFFGTAGADHVQVSMLNLSGSAVNLANKLRLDVWKH